MFQHLDPHGASENRPEVHNQIYDPDGYYRYAPKRAACSRERGLTLIIPSESSEPSGGSQARSNQKLARGGGLKSKGEKSSPAEVRRFESDPPHTTTRVNQAGLEALRYIGEVCLEANRYIAETTKPFRSET